MRPIWLSNGRAFASLPPQLQHVLKPRQSSRRAPRARRAGRSEAKKADAGKERGGGGTRGGRGGERGGARSGGRSSSARSGGRSFDRSDLSAACAFTIPDVRHRGGGGGAGGGGGEAGGGEAGGKGVDVAVEERCLVRADVDMLAQTDTEWIWRMGAPPPRTSQPLAAPAIIVSCAVTAAPPLLTQP